MYELEREEAILNLLKKKTNISVNKICETLYVSPATIRRDLIKMEKKGLIVRNFGSISLFINTTNNETAFQIRADNNLVIKRALCNAVSENLHDNSCIFIDSSTTMLHIAHCLQQYKNMTIFTNGLHTANDLVAYTNLKVNIPGGNISPSTNTIIGISAFKYLMKVHCTSALISCSSIDFTTHEIFESTIEHAEIKNLMIKNSNRTILAFDKSKVTKGKMFKNCDFKDITIMVSNYQLNNEEKDYLQSINIKYIYIDK